MGPVSREYRAGKRGRDISGARTYTPRMTAGPSAESLAAPVLVVRTRDRVHRLRPGGSYRIGRDPASDIALSDPRVSWWHAVLRTGPDGWLIEDVGSRNGTFCQGGRIERMEIDQSDLYEYLQQRLGISPALVYTRMRRVRGVLEQAQRAGERAGIDERSPAQGRGGKHGPGNRT